MACSKYKSRLKTALEYRGLPYPVEIINYMGVRAKTDRSLDKIIGSLLEIIEPPSCKKIHCPSHTTYSFCGCSKNLVPGKCPLNLEYLKRKREKEEKVLNDRIAQLPERFLPISDENKERLKNISDSEFTTWLKKAKRVKA